MKIKQKSYQASDGWLLLCIGLADGTLDSILTKAALTRMELFSYVEFEGGIFRLLNGDFIVIDEKKILLSDRGFLIFDRIINRGRSFEHSIKVLEGKMMLRRYEDIIEPRTIISFSDYQNLINAFVAKIKP